MDAYPEHHRHRRGDDAVIHSFKAAPDWKRYRDAVHATSGLSDEQINWIRDYGDALSKTSVKLYGEHNEDMVKARGSHFPLNDETRWVYEAMEAAALRMNAETYRFDLTGFSENFYYHTYDGALGEHFGWHVDAGSRTPQPRKLSLILHLSDTAEYEGGEFEVKGPIEDYVGVQGKGLITAFPSHRIHRVKPVTQGVRRSLVMFATGPHFR